MELLLARDANVEITEAVVTAAAGNKLLRDSNTWAVANRSWSCCWPEIPTSRSLRRW
jgi:hypothetical protein